MFNAAINLADNIALKNNQYTYYKIAYVAPGATINLSATGNSNPGQLNIGWTPSPTLGNSATQYTLNYRLNGTSTWNQLTLGGGGQNYILAGLLSDTVYDIRISATNAFGTGSFSSTIQARTLPHIQVTCLLHSIIGNNSDTGYIAVPKTVTGNINITISGAGADTTYTITYSNSNAIKYFLFKPTSSGIVRITCSNDFGYAINSSILITAVTNNSTFKLQQVRASKLALAIGTRLMDSTFRAPIMKLLFMPNSIYAEIGPDSIGQIGLRSVIRITDPGSSTYCLKQTMILGDIITSMQTGYCMYAYDQSGNGNDAFPYTISNAPTIISNGALLLINNRASLSFNSSFLRTKRFVVEMANDSFILNTVIKATAFSGFNRLIDQGGLDSLNQIDSKRCSLCINSTGYLDYSGENNDCSYGAFTLNAPATATIQVNAAGSKGIINGSSVINASVPNSSLAVDTGFMCIGKKNRVNQNEYYIGYMSEVVVFNKVLNSTQQQALDLIQTSYYQIQSTYTATEPLNLTASAGLSLGYVKLNWNAPLYSGGNSITDYLVEYQLNGSGSWNQFNHTASSATSITVTGLTIGSLYNFRVRSITSAGNGLISQIASFTPINNFYLVTSNNIGFVDSASVINVTPATLFTGIIKMIAVGAGLNDTISFNFTNSNNTLGMAITPRSAGVVKLYFSNNNGLIDPATPFLFTAILNAKCMIDSINVSLGAVYSFRRLTKTYLNKLATLINTNKNAQADIYPDSSGVLSQNSVVLIKSVGNSTWNINQTIRLTEFLGSDNIKVITWYDQSGNAKDMQQPTSNNQPIFSENGVLITNSGLIGIKFTGSQWLDCSSSIITPGSNLFAMNAVMNFVQTGSYVRIFDQGAGTDINYQRAGLLTSNSGTLYFSSNGNDANYPALSWGSANAIGTVIVSVPGSIGSINGVTQTNSFPDARLNITNTSTGIGRKNVGYENINGVLNELILINGNLTKADRFKVELNQGNYYKIATIPSKPNNVALTNAASAGAINVNWSQPQYQAQTITSHKVFYRLTNSNSQWSLVQRNDTVRSTTIAGLTQGSSYDVFVVAINSVGAGDSSDISSILVPINYTITLNAYSLAGDSVTISVVPAAAINGIIVVAIQGANTNLQYNLSFSNSASTQTIKVSLNSIGTYYISCTNNFGGINPLTRLLTIGIKESKQIDLTGNTPYTAFGLRQLVQTYTGPLITIRATTANVIADVTPDSTGTLSLYSVITITNIGTSNYTIGSQFLLNDFMDSSNIYISKWYDQINLANSITQTTLINQPILATNKILNMINGKPAINFNPNFNQYFTIPLSSSVFNSNATVSCVFKIDSTSNATINPIISWRPSGGNSVGIAVNSGNMQLYTTNTEIGTNMGNITKGILYTSSVSWSNYGLSNLYGSVNGSLSNPTSTIGNWFNANQTGGYLGKDLGYFNGYISELLIYSSELNVSALKLMEANQAQFYKSTYNGTIYWNGVNNNVFNSTNWLPNQVPSLSNDIYIMSNGNFPNVNSGILQVNNIVLESGMSLAVQNGATLKLKGSITINNLPLTINGNIEYCGTSAQSITSSAFLNNSINQLTINTSQNVTLLDTLNLTGNLLIQNGIFNSNGYLKLKADSLKQAKIGPIYGTLNGKVTIEQYICGIGNSGPRWRFLSPFLTNKTLKDYQNFIHITGSGTGNTVGTFNSNGFDATLSNKSSVYYYDESIVSDQDGSGSNDFNDGWTIPSTINYTLTSGKGFRLFVRGNRIDGNSLLNGTNFCQSNVKLSITGDITSGTINMPITFTSSGVNANDGWNLAGNPYPCSIDWNLVHDAGRTFANSNYSGSNYTNIDPVIYIFDALSNGYKSYNALSNGGSLTNGIIPLGAAFFIKATSTSPSLIFKEDHKTTNDTSSSSLFKNENLLTEVHLEGPNCNDVLIIQKNGEANMNYDPFDIYKMYNPGVNISTLTPNNTELSLTSMPVIEETTIIPLVLKVSSQGDYQLRFNNVKMLGRQLYLYNSVSKVKKLINEGELISIHFTTSGVLNKDYQLVFGEELNTSNIESIKEIKVGPNPFTSEFYIETPLPLKYNIQVLDIIGRPLPFEFRNNGKLIINSSYSGLIHVIFEFGGCIQQFKMIKR